MELLNWSEHGKKLHHLFNTLSQGKEKIYLWQTWPVEGGERVVHTGEIKKCALDLAEIEFICHGISSHYEAFNASEDTYFFAPASDLIFKTSIKHLQKEWVVLQLPDKLISLSAVGPLKEEGKKLSQHVMSLISGIQDNIQHFAFKEKDKIKEAKSYAFAPLQKMMLKLEDLVDDPSHAGNLLAKAKEVSMMIKGYGPVDFSVQEFTDKTLVIETDMKEVCHEGDVMEVVGIDEIRMKTPLSGTVQKIGRVKGGKKFKVSIALS